MLHVDHSRPAQSQGSSLPGTRVAAHGKRAAPLLAKFLLTAPGAGHPAYSLNLGSGTGSRTENESEKIINLSCELQLSTKSKAKSVAFAFAVKIEEPSGMRIVW